MTIYHVDLQRDEVGRRNAPLGKALAAKKMADLADSFEKKLNATRSGFESTNCVRCTR